MSKFHINKHGVPAPCRATKGNCPYGGDSGQEGHYDTKEEAQVAADEILEKEHGVFSELKSDSLSAKFPNLSKDELVELESYYDKELTLQKEVTELVKSSPEYMETDEYFERVQQVRQDALEKYAQGRKFKETLGEERQEEFDAAEGELKERINEAIGQSPNFRSGAYHASPEITEDNFDEISEVFTSYSGKSSETVKSEIADLQKENPESSYDEVSRKYWAKLDRRTDKAIVSLDFETANPTGDNGIVYDNGQMTYIIDVGAIKTHPDGTEERLEFYSGTPEGFEETHGTGFQSTHNIEPETIRGMPDLTNSDKAKELSDFMDGSVMMAHNADFETKQLTNSVPGMRAKINSGEIETLDTWKFTRYLVPEAPRNSNKNLVEAAGMEYENAHRGMADAQMTMSAFNILKDRQRKSYD